jgi:HNH endonuclease
MITQQEIKERLSYNDETGVFTWLDGRRKGIRAGSLLQHGYRVIYWKTKLEQEHRLAWLHVYCEWPKQNIDHINGNPSDNRIANLRDCSQSKNKQNTRAKTGHLKGTFFDKTRNRWRSAIGPKGSVKYLGSFKTATEAHQAYAIAAKEMYGEFARI